MSQSAPLSSGEVPGVLCDAIASPEAQGDPDTPVYWSKFIKTASNERGVAFWLWIDGILDLIKLKLTEYLE
ncbi:hypothetical protein KOW79_004765 [Hemibagrus wyckioides]|uniref:Uncharacterized protein n=1 Tax=Hemibagrus wyckioides TaxID=337641 RepID=A0A9D3NYD1_9TELE|nr:hypothetical protein KOW79_004765 [Hemibagrus wyckioides]